MSASFDSRALRKDHRSEMVQLMRRHFGGRNRINSHELGEALEKRGFKTEADLQSDRFAHWHRDALPSEREDAGIEWLRSMEILTKVSENRSGRENCSTCGHHHAEKVGCDASDCDEKVFPECARCGRRQNACKACDEREWGPPIVRRCL
jgi:hypothetical protein